MRHLKSGKKLGRTSSHRTAMLNNMCKDLIKHENIKTTLAKAKTLRPYFERLLTKAKTNNLASRRLLLGRLRNNEIVEKLFNIAQDRMFNSPGGYTRILKAGFRKGDCSAIAYIQLKDYVPTTSTKNDESETQNSRNTIENENKQ